MTGPRARSPIDCATGSGVEFVAAQALVDVADKARFAIFAVIDHVDAEFDLLLYDVGHGAAQLRGGRWCIERLCAIALDQRKQVWRPRQAAGMCRENAIGAVFHYWICM
jgi:hypothetical protein